jgi:hypothetical protein
MALHDDERGIISGNDYGNCSLRFYFHRHSLGSVVSMDQVMCRCGKWPIEKYPYSINNKLDVYACGPLCAMKTGQAIINGKLTKPQVETYRAPTR